MVTLLSNELWPTIGKLSKRSKRTKVAVAFLGTDAAKLLTLKKGDTLILAMDLNNVRSGQVNPFEVQILYDMGVLIYNLRNLHAKIYLFENKVIIGSANVSGHSANNLIEAGILTDDKKVLKRAEEFIKKNSVEKVDQDYLELCKSNYKPPQFSPGKRKPRTGTSIEGRFSRTWVISTEPTDYDEDDYSALEKDEDSFRNKITNKRAFELMDIKYPISNPFINKVQEGDILIEIVRHKVRTQVMQPKRALGVTFNSAKGKAYLRVEERKNPLIKGWARLEKILKQNGINGVKRNSTREIKNDNTKRVLLSYFND